MKRLGILALAEPSNGGTFQYTMSMLEAVSHLKNWQVTIYSDTDNHYYDDLGYTVHRVHAARKNWPNQLICDLLNIRGAEPFSQVDLLLAPIYSPILLHTRKPFAFTLHDLQEYYFPDNFSLLLRTWRKLINSRLIARASQVICESNYVRQDIIRFFGAQPEKISVIPSPPVKIKEADLSPEHIQATRKKYSLPEKYFFYPAQFWPHKNHARLLEAFALISREFPEIKLVLTGKKRDEYERVFAKIEKLGLSSRVNHIGYVDQEDIAALYLCSFALVMPTLFESVSIPAYEAFQCGTPVCVSNVVALPEQVGDAGLLFDPISVDSMAGAMRSILKDSELRINLAEAGRRRFAMMTHEAYANQLGGILDSMIQYS